MDIIVPQKPIIPRVTKLAVASMILNLNGLGFESNNQMGASVSAINIEDQFIPVNQAAQVDARTHLETYVNAHGGVGRMELKRVPISTAQQRIDQLSYSQVGYHTPQNIELI